MGTAHACALLRDGTTDLDKPLPVPAAVLDGGAQEVQAGFGMTCARRGDALWCFGSFDHGRCGNGVSASSTCDGTPLRLGPGFDSYAMGAAAQHACALVDGGAYCWGYNDRGQLGDGTLEDQSRPVPVRGLPRRVHAISTGGHHTCAVSAEGGVYCWGSNLDGQVGNGTVGGNVLVPSLVR